MYRPFTVQEQERQKQRQRSEGEKQLQPCSCSMHAVPHMESQSVEERRRGRHWK